MSRFNKVDPPLVKTAKPVATGPIATVPGSASHVNTFDRLVRTRTANGGQGFLREPKGELFLLATTSIDITADTFYARGDDRVRKFCDLVRRVAVQDPDWVYEFLVWLRGPGNIRTASIVGAVEASQALTEAKIAGSRIIIRDVLQRPDEPGEMIAYSQVRGYKLTMPMKKGIADAALRLYSERSLLKYDTASHAFRFGDVIELTHPIVKAYASDGVAVPSSGWAKRKNALFKYAIDRRHKRDVWDDDTTLPTVVANANLRSAVAHGHTEHLLSASTLNMAGMTWEDALSLGGRNVDKAALWRAMIPSMGFMARLRNLRNFDEAVLSDADVQDVVAMLGDPAKVAESRQLPLRFLSAYRHAPSLRWAYPLELALDASLSNIPHLSGRTLILVDTSYSMERTFGKDSTLNRWDAAAAFGLALARRCENADVVSFSDETKVFRPVRGESLLSAITRWKNEGYFLGSGTDTMGAVRKHFAGHDRVVILTDEQADPMVYGGRYFQDVGSALPNDTMLWTFNLAGYQVSHTEASPTRITIGGLTDHMFALIPQIENGVAGTWPWEGPAA